MTGIVEAFIFVVSRLFQHNFEKQFKAKRFLCQWKKQSKTEKPQNPRNNGSSRSSFFLGLSAFSQPFLVLTLHMCIICDWELAK